jgi:prevent-host-death family protein
MPAVSPAGMRNVWGVPMPRSVSSIEAKNQLSSLIGWSVTTGDEVIIENHGKPRAVIMSYGEYETVQRLREQARRQAALDQLERLRERASARNADLTDEQAQDLADQIARDVIENLAARGEIRFDTERS